MAQKTQMGAAEGLKLKQAEQDIANGKTLADVIAELKRCNETACKKEVKEVKDSQKMGAAEGLKLKQAEQDIANGKTLKEVLEELRKSNAEKKAKKKIEETLDEVDKTTKQTLNEVTGKGKGKKDNLTVEQQVETARETAKQTGLLEKIEENTRGKATAEKDKSGFDFGKLFTGLKVIGALTALGIAAWGLVESFDAAKKWWDGLFGGGPNGSRTTTEKIADAAKLAAPVPGAVRGFSKNAEAALKQYEIGAGSKQLRTDAEKDLAAAKKEEAKLREKHATAEPGSKAQKALARELTKAEIKTASAQNGVEYAKGHQAGAGPRVGATAGRVVQNTYKGFNPGKMGLGLSVLGFGLGEFAAGGDAASIARQAAAGTAGTAFGAAAGAGIGTAVSIGFAGATGGFGAVAAPVIIGAFKLVGGYIGGIIAAHMEKQHAKGQPLTLPPLSAFDLTQVSVEDIKAFVNAVVERLGMDPPFSKDELTKPSANWKGATKDAPMNWTKGRWGADTRAYKEGSSWFIHRVDHKGKTIKKTEMGVRLESEVAELNKLEADTLAAPMAGSPIAPMAGTSTPPIDFGKSTAKPIDDWTDTLSAGTAQRVAIAGLGAGPTATPNSDATIAEQKALEAEARLSTAEAIAKEEAEASKTSDPVTAAIEAKEGEGVFGTIVSVLKGIGTGIESIVSLMSGGLAAGAGAIASGASNAASAVANSVSSYSNKAKSITSGTPENASIAMEFFKSRGWSRNQAAAIVGNLQQESTANLDPKSNRGPNTGYGIAQWIPGDRQDKFKQVIGKDIRGSSLQDQLEFVDWELKNSEKASGKELRGLDDVTSATLHVATNYERTPTDHGKRVNNAKLLAANDATPSTATSNATAGGGSTELRFAKGKGEKGTNPAVFAKLRQVQVATGINFLVTSAYRSREKNKGAADSQHIYGRAVDVTFGGGKEATIKAIRAASAAGFVGIGVYNPGALHFDIRPAARVCWGPNYHGDSIPAWAKQACADHMAGRIRSDSVVDNIADEINAPNSRTNASMDVGEKVGTKWGAAVGGLGDSALGTTGGEGIGAAVGAVLGKVVGGGVGGATDILTSILKDIPVRKIPLKAGPYVPGTTIPLDINGKGKFSQSMTSAMDLIGASNRNDEMKNTKASKPITISNPFIDLGNTTTQVPNSVPYPTRNTDPTLMKYLDMLMGVA